MLGRSSPNARAHVKGTPATNVIQKFLAGRRALVTGADFGVGRAIAMLFGTHGASVAVHYLADRESAEAVVGYIIENGGKAFPCRANVSSGTDIRRMFREIVPRLGGIDTVVATPGAGDTPASTGQDSTGRRREILDTALIGQYLCALAAVRQFRRRRVAHEWPTPNGKIIFVSPPHRATPWTGQASYAGADATEMMVRSVALDVEKYRICVNCIVPVQEAPPVEPSPARRQRDVELDDVAKAALWLASNEAGTVTGRTWVVNRDVKANPTRTARPASDEVVAKRT